MRAARLLLVPSLALAFCATAAMQAPSAGARPLPPAPALQAGGQLTDSAGQRVGQIQSVGEASNGEMFVIVNIDGSLVSVPETRLRWNGRDAVADTTKAQLLTESRRGPPEPMPPPGGRRP